MVFLVPGCEQGTQVDAPTGVDDLARGEGGNRVATQDVLQPGRELGMAPYRATECLLQPV